MYAPNQKIGKPNNLNWEQCWYIIEQCISMYIQNVTRLAS